MSDTLNFHCIDNTLWNSTKLILLLSVYTYFPSQIRPSGSGSGRPAPHLAPGPRESGGHVKTTKQGGGVLQPGSAAGSCGWDIGAAGQDDLPAGERWARRRFDPYVIICSRIFQLKHQLSLQVWTVSWFLSSTQTFPQETVCLWLWSLQDSKDKKENFWLFALEF